VTTAINANYPRPVVVDGYPCWNCHQVSEAKKGIDPNTQGPFSAQSPSAAGGPITPAGASAQAAGSTAGATQTTGLKSTARLDILV
jgi:hypothetical protein